jgi:hypothetical protein
MSCFFGIVYEPFNDYFFFFKNLIKNFKNKFFFGKLALKISNDKTTYFILVSNSFKINGFLKNYQKLNNKPKTGFKFEALIKNDFKSIKFKHFSISNSNIFQTLLIKKKTFKRVKNLKLIEKFKVFSVFFSKKNFKVNLLVKFFSPQQIRYFLHSVCDEILLFGKIRSILKQTSKSILINKENFLDKPFDSEIFINCSDKKKNPNFRIFFFVSSKEISLLRLSSSIQIHTKFAFIKKKKNIFKNQENSYLIKSDKLSKFSISNGFSLTEFNI